VRPFVSALLAGISGTLGGSRVSAFLRRAAYRLAGPAPVPEGPTDGVWCLFRPPAGTLEDPHALLYFLHPACGDAGSWANLPLSRVFYARAKALGVPAPRVVGVSYGPLWSLLPTAGAEQPSLLERFVEEDLAHIERSLGVPARRLVWGMSQGGFNAASLLLAYPRLFARGAVSCPAFYDFPIYSDEEAHRFVMRSGAVPELAWWGLERLRPRVGGPEAWEREDPLARAAGARELPPTLVQATRGDEYGFFPGAERFATALAVRGLPATWAPEPGGHCVFDVERAADFLLAPYRAAAGG